jgi:hypothetical protein
MVPHTIRLPLINPIVFGSKNFPFLEQPQEYLKISDRPVGELQNFTCESFFVDSSISLQYKGNMNNQSALNRSALLLGLLLGGLLLGDSV